MKTKERYICEGCGQEFDDYDKCERHEADCDDKHLQYRENVGEAICWAKIKFGNLIDYIDFNVDEEIDC